MFHSNHIPILFGLRKKLEAKDVLSNINCMQATALPSPPAVTEWSRLLVLEVICSMHVTMHFQWGGNLSLVILTFDLDIQSRPSEGPNTSSL